MDNDLFFTGTSSLAQPKETIPADQFYQHPGTGSWTWWEQLLQREHRFAFAVFFIGFMAVFVSQMPLPLQIVLGAPIFEEMFKFGLALLLVLPLPWAIPRMISGFLIGAGFGVMEHYTTYASEADIVFLWRVAFHSISTGASMLFYVLLRHQDRLQWPVAMAPSIFLHYINNTGAVFLALGGVGEESIFFSVANIAVLAVLAGLGLMFPGTWHRFAAWLTERLWGRSLHAARQTASKSD